MRDAALQNVTLSLGAISDAGQVLQSDKMSMDRACMGYTARHFLSISAFWKFLASISNIVRVSYAFYRQFESKLHK